MLMKYAHQLFELISPEKKNIKNIYFLVILQGVFYLMVPLGIQSIITYTMAGQMSASLILLALLTVTAVLFIGLFQLWQMRINETIQQSLLINVSLKFSKKLSVLNPDLYLADYLPSKINQFFDVLTLQKGLSKIALDLSFSVISIVFGLLILTGYSPVFLIFTVVISFAFYIIIKVYGTKSLKVNIEASEKKYSFVNWLHQLYNGIKHQDHSFNKDYIIRQTDQALSEYITAKTTFFKYLDVQYKSILFFKVLFTSVLLFLGIWLVQSGYLNIGQFVAAEILIILVINAVEKLVLSLNVVYDVLTATKKLYQVFELEEQVNASNNELAEATIQLEQVFHKKMYQHNYSKNISQLLYGLVFISVVVLCLPWTQTVSADGKVSTIDPSNRPQTVPSRISGRIEEWYVKEGDWVKKGDTIAYISEVKEDYFDPLLVNRTEAQVKSKESSISSYEQKINSIDVQIDAINNGLRLKLEQGQNKILQAKAKVMNDSADYIAISANFKISEDQFKRYEELLQKGIISKTEYEARKGKLQENQAKKVSAENKWMNAKSELMNAVIDLNTIKQEYNEKLMKAESDKFSAMSNLYDAEASLTKMQNQLSNYSIRSGLYYVTAPQDGYITKSYSQGIGEFVKDGSPLVSIVPHIDELSVEFFVDPMEVALLENGNRVQLTFDGWPAFVFSGWPGASFGSYQAKIVAIDQVISDNGKFRVLAVKADHSWPKAIRVGGGVKALVMLKDVPVIYEIWRHINGFPPDFYSNSVKSLKENNKNEKKQK